MKNKFRKRKSMYFNRVSLLIIFCWGSSFSTSAQSLFLKKKYPSTFQNPVDIPISIIGNFGECRPNHFHSGIDIRTESKENQTVRSVANGYVSRVKIGAGEFGNAIYITHGELYQSATIQEEKLEHGSSFFASPVSSKKRCFYCMEW